MSIFWDVVWGNIYNFFPFEWMDMVDKGGGSVSFDLDGMKGNAWDGCCQGYRWVRVLGF